MSRLRMAVIGVGALGRHHARILAGLPDVELVAVADTNSDTAARVASQHGTQSVGDYRELLPRVDAAVVAVPTFLHAAVAADFLQRQIPILVEKPLAASVDECRQLVELADREATILQVGHVERFNPATQTMRQLCGPPKYIRSERLAPYTFRSTDIGVVHDLMIHDIDLVLDLVRAPLCRVEAFGICVMGRNEDCAQARLTFANGCIADLTASRISPTPSRTMQVWSSSGCVTADFTSREVACYSPSDALRYGATPLERSQQPGADLEQLKRDVFEKFITVSKPSVSGDDALTAELSSFVECVKTRSRPVVDGEQALEALLAAERILEQIAAHQWDGHADGAVGPHARNSRRRKLAG